MRIERFPVGPLDNNLYLLTSDQGTDAIVVDPSLESAGVLEQIAARGLTVKRILLTHAHVDTLMVKPYWDETGAPVWLHAATGCLYEFGGQQAEWLGLPWPGSSRSITG